MVDGGLDEAAGAAQDALLTDAGVQEAKVAGRVRPGQECSNCGALLRGPHCHMCGQIADDLHRPFWSLLGDVLEGMFSLDGRFLKTVPPLLLRPGRVSQTYLSGARARFVQPIRLFLFASLAFLLAVSIASGDWTDVNFDGVDGGGQEEAVARGEAGIAEARAALEANGISTEGLDRAEEEIAAIGRDSGDAATSDPRVLELQRLERHQLTKCQVRAQILPEELGASCEAILAEHRDEEAFTSDGIDALPLDMRRLIQRNAERVIDDPRLYFESVNRWVSRMLIALFPIYAALLGFSHFWKRRFYYYDHVVVSLHFHAFIFLLLTIAIAASVLLPVWLLAFGVLVWSNYYLYKTHRLVYGCGRFSSALRTLVLDTVYGVILLLAMVVLLIGGFLAV